MIPEVNPYNNYRGDGVATLFDYDFFIQNGSQLIVEHIDENDVVTRLEENIDYEIVVIEEEFAGYIKFPIEDSKFGILQENETLSLQLTLPFEQISEYGQSSLLDLNSIEFSLDYLTRLCQILKRQMERSVRVNEGSEATPEQLLETINNNAIVSTNAATIASKKADEAMESANIAANASEEINNKIAGFNESFEEMVDEITQEGEKQLQNVQSTGFYMRDDKLYFINSEGEEEEFKSGGAGAVMFDTKIADHILQGEEAKGWALQGTYVTKDLYPDFYSKCLEQKNNAIESQVTLGSSTLTMFVNSNGHQFYNIVDKSIVDTFYNSNGIADFYGIDEENERVFLPRNKWFAIKNPPSTVPVYGNGMALGIYDGTNAFGLGAHVVVNGQPSVLTPYAKNYGTAVGSTRGDYTTTTRNDDVSWGVTNDPSKSGLIAKTSNVIQTNENKYLYYCVGNTVVNDAQIDAGGLVSQMELKANATLDNILPQGKSLASFWAMPSGKFVNLTLGASETRYTAPANGYVHVVIDVSANGFLSIQDNYYQAANIPGYVGGRVALAKGQSFYVAYGNYLSTVIFRFIYAEGDK